jgi:3-isopropylmalate/(R)-2-methylmalate dehydratase large subunit
MKMTLTQKILALHSGKEQVQAGDFILADIDIALANDITAPPAIKEFKKMGKEKVFDKKKIALIPDHFTPNKDIKAAVQAKTVREFANEQEILHYYEVGQMGIVHVILPEFGIVTAGNVVIGADSHTCTYGALSAFSTGVGSTDLAFGMSTGKAWFKVPPAIKVVLKGKLQKHVSGKDIILYLIGQIGVDGALYKSLEFQGDISSLSMDDRFTVANMAIEAGAKNGIFETDEKTIEYIMEHSNPEYSKPMTLLKADPDAEYERTVEIDLDNLAPIVAFPHLPENSFTFKNGELKPIGKGHGEIPEKIDQVVIGSCTNGRIEDMRIAAEILDGKKVAKGVRLIVIPGSQKVFLESMEKGYAKIFVEAGGVFSTPTCGPCLGGHMGILADGEKCVSTTNRNFVGRMGDVTSEIYLASPAVAAASAISGKIAMPEK